MRGSKWRMRRYSRQRQASSALPHHFPVAAQRREIDERREEMQNEIVANDRQHNLRIVCERDRRQHQPAPLLFIPSANVSDAASPRLTASQRDSSKPLPKPAMQSERTMTRTAARKSASGITSSDGTIPHAPRKAAASPDASSCKSSE